MIVRRRLATTLAAALFLAVSIAGAQQPIGSVALGDLVQGLGVNTRVLVIGAHPDDEDTYLISWLARGRHVETAYLSLTRGEGGQNLIGNELGYALGQIRTEELLAARRVDGGHQYFTRAVDFGFSKSLVETSAEWPQDLILRDVVAVIRSFRPHVIVSAWTGTEADGHGHHQYSGVIAKLAFEAAGDTSLFRDVVGMPRAWSPSKFYRTARVRGGSPITANYADSPGNVKHNVGEYSPLFGRSYAEIAAQSRSQHLSQGMGMVLPVGTIWDGLSLDTSRVGLTRDTDSSLFAGIDTTWSRFAAVLSPTMREAIDSVRAATLDARRSFDAVAPTQMVFPLSRVLRFARDARRLAGCPATPEGLLMCQGPSADFALALNTTIERASKALVVAAGVTVDALSDREKVAIRDSVDVTVSIYNRGKALVAMTGGSITIEGARTDLFPPRPEGATMMIAAASDSAVRLGGRLEMPAVTYPWWLIYGADQKYYIYDLQDFPGGKRGALPREMLVGDDRLQPSSVNLVLTIDGTEVNVNAGPIVHRFADPAKGEKRHPMVGVPRISTLFQSSVEYIRANKQVERGVRLELTSAWSKPDTVIVQLPLPPGLGADSATRRVVLPAFGKVSVFFRVRGTVPQKEYKLFGRVSNRSGFYQQGFVEIVYDHIQPVRYYQPPELILSAVDLVVPEKLNVAYVRGVGDNVMRMLEQLDVKVKAIPAEAIPTLDPAAYSTLVIGPRAFEANDAALSAVPFIQDFARRGGTVVTQYQQFADRPGVLPFPVTFSRPVDRVTNESAEVTFMAPTHRVVTLPNKITADDFKRWGQERALYMPRTFDAAWKPIFEMHDPGEPPNYGALLVAPLGKGTFVYTSLSFFRQLPGGHPGAARLFVNLLSAGLRAGPTP